MAIAHFSYVTCDRCGGPGPLGDDAKEARTLASRERWATRTAAQHFDLCSACAHGVRFDDVREAFVPVQRPTPLPSWREAT